MPDIKDVVNALAHAKDGEPGYLAGCIIYNNKLRPEDAPKLCAEYYHEKDQ